MRHVPIAEFETNISEFTAAARGGEEIVVTREGREELRLMLTDEAKMARKKAAILSLFALGQAIKAKNGPTTAAEIRAWVNEGRP